MAGRHTCDYYGSSAPSDTDSRQRTCPPPTWPAGGRATSDGSHVHCRPIVGLGAQLCPCGLATPTPQSSAWPPYRRLQTVEESPVGVHRCPARICQVRAGVSLEGRNNTGFSRTPSHLASRTRTVWQCRPVPALSGLLPTLTRVPGIRLPPASAACCDRPPVESFHLHSIRQRLVALEVPDPGARAHPTDPAAQARSGGEAVPRLPPARHHHAVRRVGGRHRHESPTPATRATAGSSSSSS
jgi:hypothetical protein